jgi:hypothetical protein
LGFHAKLTITVSQTKVSVLKVIDVDSGSRCLLLRESVDANRDGELRGEEVQNLKKRLVSLATRPLSLTLSGAPLPMQVVDSKLSLRNDRRVNDSPLSIAVLLEFDDPTALREGLVLGVTDVAPDASSLVLQVFQRGETALPAVQEVPSGSLATFRLRPMKE